MTNVHFKILNTVQLLQRASEVISTLYALQLEGRGRKDAVGMDVATRGNMRDPRGDKTVLCLDRTVFIIQIPVEISCYSFLSSTIGGNCLKSTRDFPVLFLGTACESTVMSKRFNFLKRIEEFRKKVCFFPITFGNEDVVNPLASKAVDEKKGAGSLEQRLLAGTRDFLSAARVLPSGQEHFLLAASIST